MKPAPKCTKRLVTRLTSLAVASLTTLVSLPKLQAAELRIGFYSGTFDPPHSGHLSLIREAAQRLGLNRIVILPTPTPPLKPNAISFAHRQVMARLAFSGLGGPRLSNLNVRTAPFDLAAIAEAGGITAVIDDLSAKAPSGAEVFQIMGADALDRLLARPDWVVPTNFSVVVAERSEQREFPARSPNGRPILKLDFSTGSISSTEIRSALRAGNRHEALSVGVAEYAREQGLYGSPLQMRRPVSCWTVLLSDN
jgi:nicotinate-nucleotide adenylyltransferase